MFTTLNISQLTSQSIKSYLNEKGYNAAIKADNRPTKYAKRTFAVKFTDYQPVAQRTLATIAEKFPLLSHKCTSTFLVLTDQAAIEILPLLPDLKTVEKTDLVNTEFAGKINTGAYTADSSSSILPARRTRTQAMKDNALALEIVGSTDFEKKVLTTEERVILENYAGVGGQYEEGNQEHNIDALTQFYTPDFVCEKIYKIAHQLGFPKDGKVLEPSCGVGRLIKHAPDYSKVVGFEISEIPYKISSKLYPQATIHHQYFEQAFLKAPRFTDIIRGSSPTWVEQYPFDMVIGNPPYGKHKNKWQSFFSYPKFPQIEFFFMYYGTKLLKPGGLLIFVTSSNFIRTGLSYQTNKDKVLELLKVVGAYRMPNHFMELTDVGSDILIFRKK